jgi:hypothetical protein
MTDPLPGGPGFDFGVYFCREVGFTMPEGSLLPFIADCCFVWSLSFDLSDMGVPTRSLNFHQHGSPGHSRTRKPPHHDKVAVLEEGFCNHGSNFLFESDTILVSHFPQFKV